MKKILFLAAFFCTFFVISTNAQSNPTEKIAALENGVVTIVAPQNVLAACFTQFELFENSNPNTFELWTDAEEQYFLTAKGTIDGKAIIIKVNLEMRVGGGFYTPLAPQGESCTGVNCSQCSFVKSGGCGCKTIGNPSEGGGYCNHTTTKP
jgi:hypothetical protein